MKFYYRMLIAIFMVMASVTNLAAQYDCLYLVGNVSGWNSPSQSNADFYQNYKLQSDGDYLGSPILKGSFDVSSLVEPPMFRFYSALEGWEQNSYGSQYQDMPVDFSLSAMENGQALTEGKGSFNIPDWTGTTLYITVWNGIVWASNFGYFDPTTLPVVIRDEVKEVMTSCAGETGIYSASLQSVLCSIRIKGAAVGQPEKEWLYVSPKKDLVSGIYLESDEYGIIICDIEYSDSPVEFSFLTYGSTFDRPDFMTYLDLNNKKLYANNSYSKWLGGSFNDCPVITFNNYKDYDQYLLSSYTGNKVLAEIPAGHASIICYTPSLGNSQMSSYQWDVNIKPYIWAGINSVNEVEWPGGTLIADNRYLGFIKSMDEMYLWTNTLEGSATPVKLEPISSGVFEGVVNLSPGLEENKIGISFGNKTNSCPGLIAIIDKSIIFNEETKSLSFNYKLGIGASWVSFNQFPNGAQIKVTIDRNNETVSYAVAEGEIQNVPIMRWTDPVNEYTGGYMFKRYDRNIFINDMYINGNWKDRYHIEMSDGSILVPNWNDGVNEGYGISRYPVSFLNSDEIPEQAFLSISEPFYKWNGNEFFGNTVFQIDVENNELMIYQSDDARSEITVEHDFRLPKCLYLEGMVYDPEVQAMINAFTGGPQWYNLNNSRDYVLPLFYDEENKCGIYEGKFKLTNQPSDWSTIYLGIFPVLFSNSPALGLQAAWADMIPNENDIFEKDAIISNYISSVGICTKDAPSDDYTIRVYIYGPDHAKIWIGNGAATIKEVELNDVEALHVTGLQGAILFETLMPVNIDVYSVNGSLVRKFSVPAGSSTLDGFLPGVYIVNGAKVLVR